MPKCINDPLKTYKGDEPSPKGLGYCAHAEEIGTIKLGKDTRAWIVKQIKNGNKRWVLQSKNIFVGSKIIKNLDDNKISHLNLKDRKKLFKFFEKDFKNNLNKLGIKLFVVSLSDWKLGDSYIVDKKVKIMGQDTSTRLDKKRNPLDWHREDIRETLIDIENEEKGKIIFVFIEYDSIKKRYVSNLNLYYNFKLNNDESKILKKYNIKN